MSPQSVAQALAAQFGMPARPPAGSPEAQPWLTQPQDSLGPRPQALTLRDHHLSAYLGLRPVLLLGGAALGLGLFGGGLLSGVMMQGQIGARAWLAFGPLAGVGLWVLWTLLRRRGRRCGLRVDDAGVSVGLSDGDHWREATLPWTELRSVEIVADKRGRPVLRLTGPDTSLYFGGGRAYRAELEWARRWIASLHPRSGATED